MAESPDSRIIDPIFDKFEEVSDAISSRDTATTPSSEITRPDSPVEKHARLDPKTKPRRLAASLSLEEQVRYFWSIGYTLLIAMSGLFISGSRLLEIKISSF